MASVRLGRQTLSWTHPPVSLIATGSASVSTAMPRSLAVGYKRGRGVASGMEGQRLCHVVDAEPLSRRLGPPPQAYLSLRQSASSPSSPPSSRIVGLRRSIREVSAPVALWLQFSGEAKHFPRGIKVGVRDRRDIPLLILHHHDRACPSLVPSDL